MYDRAIVEHALQLSGDGFSDQAVALMCGVSVGALRHWRRGDRRGKGLEDRRNKSACPRCHERDLDRPSYAYLLGLYLGDGHIAKAPGNKGVFRLEIACCDDWPGLIEATAVAVAAVMPGLSIGRRSQPGCTNVGAYSKHWPCVFPQHGPGMKHTRKISLAPWQRQVVDGHAEEFVRGLIHSDGCRVINRVRRQFKSGERRYEYTRYFFANASEDIRNLYTDSLDRLGIEWKQNNARNISVARREAVARMDEFVGPKY